MPVYKLIEVTYGKTNTLFLGTFEDIKQYLIENDLFSWIKENEENKELPDFKDVETIEEISSILKRYDYDYWEIIIESDF